MVEAVANPIENLSISSDPGEVRSASEWLEKICLERGVPAGEISRLDLCLNEALANVISHGGEAVRSSTICLHLEVKRVQNFSEAELMVADVGVAFDPIAAPPKPRPTTLAEAEPGGLGLLMMRSLSDNLSYCYSNGRNQLTFSVRWANS
jgi:anti-sigma regulatory factor (Ser/Thr protein kinase)